MVLWWNLDFLCSETNFLWNHNIICVIKATRLSTIEIFFLSFSMKLHQTDYCQITSLCHVKDLIWMLRHFNVLRTKTWKMKENISIVLNLVACKLPLFYISRCSFTENLLHFVKFRDSTIKSCTFCNYFILNCRRARIKLTQVFVCLWIRDEILAKFCSVFFRWKKSQKFVCWLEMRF